MSDQGKNIDDVMEEYNRIHKIPIDVTDSITHEEFVSGVADKTIGFKVMGSEPITLVRGVRKFIFNILVALYLFAPILVIPFWAYHESNWWLLIGIPIASYVAPQLAQRNGFSIGGLLVLACIIFCLLKGIHNYFTFFSLSGLWGYMTFTMAENAQNEYAMHSLVENPEVFDKAIADKRILVVRKR